MLRWASQMLCPSGFMSKSGSHRLEFYFSTLSSNLSPILSPCIFFNIILKFVLRFIPLKNSILKFTLRFIPRAKKRTLWFFAEQKFIISFIPEPKFIPRSIPQLQTPAPQWSFWPRALKTMWTFRTRARARVHEHVFVAVHPMLHISTRAQRKHVMQCVCAWYFLLGRTFRDILMISVTSRIKCQRVSHGPSDSLNMLRLQEEDEGVNTRLQQAKLKMESCDLAPVKPT